MLKHGRLNAAEQLLDDVQREANLRNDEVLVRLLERYDEEKVVVTRCRNHDRLFADYTKASKAYSYVKRQTSNLFMIEDARIHRKQKRIAYRKSVWRCGCSNKYDSFGRKTNDGRERPTTTVGNASNSFTVHHL